MHFLDKHDPWGALVKVFIYLNLKSNLGVLTTPWIGTWAPALYISLFFVINGTQLAVVKLTKGMAAKWTEDKREECTRKTEPPLGTSEFLTTNAELVLFCAYFIFKIQVYICSKSDLP